MKENVMATNFEPHEYVIFVQSTKIGTHENKAIHSIFSFLWLNHLTPKWELTVLFSVG